MTKHSRRSKRVALRRNVERFLASHRKRGRIYYPYALGDSQRRKRVR